MMILHLFGKKTASAFKRLIIRQRNRKTLLCQTLAKKIRI
jgi:hypothetical protein